MPTFAEKLHNCFGSISADFGVGVGEGEAVEQQLAQGAHLADLKQAKTERPSITRSSVRARFFSRQDEELHETLHVRMMSAKFIPGIYDPSL